MLYRQLYLINSVGEEALQFQEIVLIIMKDPWHYVIKLVNKHCQMIVIIVIGEARNFQKIGQMFVMKSVLKMNWMQELAGMLVVA